MSLEEIRNRSFQIYALYNYYLAGIYNAEKHRWKKSKCQIRGIQTGRKLVDEPQTFIRYERYVVTRQEKRECGCGECYQGHKNHKHIDFKCQWY